MIYKFTPVLKTLVWGTENWVISGVEGSETRVAEGPQKGKTINEVYGGEFPLLIKFIDARDDLSIQVHPDDEMAEKRHHCKGKTEMWYIIGASEGAHLLSGLKRKITPDEYVQLVENHKILDVLVDHKVQPGDVFFLPAGRIHAICGGCYLAEIQETSDITYRIYDYNRPGLDGKPRQLHTELAKDAIDYNVYPDYKLDYTPSDDKENVLVTDPHFTTSVYKLNSLLIKDLSELDKVPGNFLAVMCLEGEGYVNDVEIASGEAVLAMGENQLTFKPKTDTLKLLTSHL